MLCKNQEYKSTISCSNLAAVLVRKSCSHFPIFKGTAWYSEGWWNDTSGWGRTRTPLDLLVTDVIMPDTKGHEISSQLSAYIPVWSCFHVRYTTDVIADHGVLNEGDNFISKPFSPKKIAEKVREAIEKRKTYPPSLRPSEGPYLDSVPSLHKSQKAVYTFFLKTILFWYVIPAYFWPEWRHC